jgi:hypothetical protein
LDKGFQMNHFWNIKQNGQTFSGLMTLPEDIVGPPDAVFIDFPNFLELAAAGFYDPERSDPIPIIELALTNEEFDSDFFEWEGHFYVSERMRTAMALTPSAARFFEVDATQSAPLPRSKNYQAMEVLAIEDVSDPDKSDYDLSGLAPGEPRGPYEVRNLAFRPDAKPKHDIFYDKFYVFQPFVTDDLAVRVLSAGCVGMSFSSPNLWEGESVVRTLRGAEKSLGWDQVTNQELTEIARGFN